MINYNDDIPATFLMILLNSNYNNSTTISNSPNSIQDSYRQNQRLQKSFPFEERTNQENNYFDDLISYYLKVSKIHLDSAPFEWWKQQLDDNRLKQLHQLVGKFLVIVRQQDIVTALYSVQLLYGLR